MHAERLPGQELDETSGTTATRSTGEPENWDDLFLWPVDGAAVRFVRPADTDRPSWGAYDAETYLGTVHAQHDALNGTWPVWHVQTLDERHPAIEDAVRAIRRPPSWTRERDQARRWAVDLLNDPELLVFDIQTTGLGEAWAMQIGALDRGGTVMLNELVNPRAIVESAAVTLHGLTLQHVATAPTFSDLLPTLTRVFSEGRRCVSYNLAFDYGVLERELKRQHQTFGGPAADWLERCRWEDAMQPYADWKGLWSVRRGSYRHQRLGGRYESLANCRALLELLSNIAQQRLPSCLRSTVERGSW